MDEEITIINTNTRNKKIKDFFINNKKNLIVVISIIILLLIGYFAFDETKKRAKIKLANEYNRVTMFFNEDKKEKATEELISIINKQDDTYSPLALYFLIDNNLIDNKDEINNLFDVLINEIHFENEIKNLIIYKKALYNSNFADESALIKILDPIINSKSIWKSHGLYLMAEYFYSKNEKQKAKEFFSQILTLSNINNEIKLESQKRLNRDLSE
jgi:predicted negative regulator of RcsB-dependent stress response